MLCYIGNPYILDRQNCNKLGVLDMFQPIEMLAPHSSHGQIHRPHFVIARLRHKSAARHREHWQARRLHIFFRFSIPSRGADQSCSKDHEHCTHRGVK